MNAYLDTIASPVGSIAFAVNERGALLRLRFVAGRYRTTIEEALLRDGCTLLPNDGRADLVKRELTEYWAGVRRGFTFPLVMRGTEWQMRCWQALITIPYGETRTYGAMAAVLGNPQAARAVGRANATNYLPLVVPCHRLVGSTGALTGFEGGIELKQQLLEHEQVTR
jgi:methylated-DNA-[protein]-cysteine S-methyltransferase